MVLPLMLVLVAAVTAIPTTVELAPLLESVLIMLLLILMTGEVFEHVIPITVPPAPVELRLAMVLPDIVTVVAVLTVEPIVTPVIAPCPLIFVTVLLDKLETPFQYVKFITFTVATPVVQLFTVLPVTVRVAAVPPSV